MVFAHKKPLKTVVLPMRCHFTDHGMLKIENIAAGIGVIFYHAGRKLAAGTHVLRAKSPSGNIAGDNPAYYADTAIEYILQHFRQQGAHPPLSIAIAGGGSMLPQSQGDVGTKIVMAVKEVLAKYRLNVKLEQTGGSKVRFMMLDVEAGKIKIE
jgi:chemotaxis receptor (MCP) glutamine deamidase CheD